MKLVKKKTMMITMTTIMMVI